MAFFLGLSIVSILECFCYCCNSIANKCNQETEDEVQQREQWQQRMNENDDDTEGKDTARRRAAARQQQFNEMESRLQRMDANLTKF